MEIYVKPAKKAVLYEIKYVTVGDLCEVYAPTELLARVQNVRVLRVHQNEKRAYLVSVIDMIAAINMVLPGHVVSNVGAAETLVEYAPIRHKENAAFKWLKIIFVVVVLFVGSSTAIMSFHSDAQMPAVFRNYYKMFTGVETEHPLLIDLPYSLGIAVGIIAFFNHFTGRKMTADPTPIEVELTTYEADVTDTMVALLAKEKNGGEDA